MADTVHHLRTAIERDLDHRGAPRATHQSGAILLPAVVGAAAGAIATALVLLHAPRRRDDDDPFYQPLT